MLEGSYKIQAFQPGQMDVQKNQVDRCFAQGLEGIQGVATAANQAKVGQLVDVVLQDARGDGLVLHNEAMKRVGHRRVRK